ncbi:MAG: DNA-binding protein WhiA [Clostridia bacterium]|nr:DNA-binding protein WhiA [Clostridia bacterium]
MSYSYDVKQKLLSISAGSCCRKAELYGFLLFSNTVSDSEIRLFTAYPEIRARYLNFLMEAGVKKFELACQGKTVKKYLCRISHPRDLRNLREFLGSVSFASPLRIDPSLLEKDCCRRAFLRGVFMANGVMVSPEKTCSIEFKTAHQTLGGEFFEFCKDAFDLLPGSTVRNGKKLIYFKSWDSIKDFVALIGAKDAVYDLANREIEHSFRSTANRRFNCDTANIQRSVDAATDHRRAIEFLFSKNISLPDPLLEIARLRLQYPEDTLSALGQKCDPPISKAGAAHRLKKICALAEEKGGA